MEKKSEAKQVQKNWFVLVHGTRHGAWCWYKVALILKTDGHEVTALDLGASGVNQTRMEQLTSLEDYVRPLMESLEVLSRNERVILVGHSLGGCAISIAMERFPEKIMAAAFVSGHMPSPGTSFAALAISSLATIDDLMDSKVTPEEEDPVNPFYWGFNFMATKLYQNCPPEDSLLAQYLVRPFSLSSLRNEEGIKLSTERYGTVRRMFVVCEEDMLLKEDFQRWMIEKNPPDEVKVIRGADHMAMMSKPRELSSLLLDITTDHS